MLNISAITHHYAIAALWSSCDDGGEPLDSLASADDISPTTYARMLADCTSFVSQYGALLRAGGQPDEQIGHDFWLTRNGHGAGFWDRGLGAIGERLAQAARLEGSVDLYLGDDGKVWA